MTVAFETDTEADVTIAIARDPALVRTVRLVAAAVARRADCEESLTEEIRLAVGEACAVMIGSQEPRADSDGHVEVGIGIVDGFKVTVTGKVAPDGSSGDSAYADLGLDPWALLRGIAENLQVQEHEGFTRLQMSWPA